MVVLVAATGTLQSKASAATSYTFRGLANCITGGDFQGVWVDSSDGGSNFADWEYAPTSRHIAYYSRKITVDGTSHVHISVGCGATHTNGSWDHTFNSGNKDVTSTYVYNVDCGDPKVDATKCTGSPSPPGRGGPNPFDKGFCTYGAAEYWKAAQGSYPPWNGDAKYWATRAADLGFRTGVTPRERSVIVIQYPTTGDKRGHVGWVTNVKISGSGYVVTFIEMNGDTSKGGGFNKWDTTTITWNHDTMKFIIPRAGPPVTHL